MFSFLGSKWFMPAVGAVLALGLLLAGFLVYHDIESTKAANVSLRASVATIEQANNNQAAAIVKLQADTANNTKLILDSQTAKNVIQGQTDERKKSVAVGPSGSASPALRCAISGVCK